MYILYIKWESFIKTIVNKVSKLVINQN